jgi:hypothetical protein
MLVEHELTTSHSVWEAAAEAQTKARREYLQKQADEAAMAAKIRDEMKASVTGAR